MYVLSFQGRKHIPSLNLLNELYYLGLKFFLCEVRQHLNVSPAFKHTGKIYLCLADTALNQ